MNKRWILLLGLVLIALISGSVLAQETLEPRLLEHPDEMRAAYYQENAADIVALREIIMEEGETEQRLEALRQLSIEYPDAALTTAIELVDDDTPEIALEASNLLAASIVMSDHDMTGLESTINARHAYHMDQHELARSVLRDSLESPHPEVRESAAGILASLSDEEALRKINEGVGDTMYSELEAVNYMALAAPEVSGPYLADYLENGSTSETRATAVTYLGSNALYRDQIRDDILLNSEMDVMVRSAAADTLSLYDADYQNYALILALDPTLPPDLYITVIESYVGSAQADNSLNPAKARVLNRALDNYHDLNEDVDMSEVEKQLDQYLE